MENRFHGYRWEILLTLNTLYGCVLISHSIIFHGQVTKYSWLLFTPLEKVNDMRAMACKSKRIRNIHWLPKTRIYLTPYVCTYWTSFWQPTVHVRTTYWSIIRGTWDFKFSDEFEIDVIFLRKQRFYSFQRLTCTVPPKIDRFGRKRRQ